MKETQLLSTDIEFVAKQQKQQEYKKLGSIVRKIDGSKIYVVDKETAQISEAVYQSSPIFHINGSNTERLHIEKGKIYVESLNMQNAVKRVKKGKILFHT